MPLTHVAAYRVRHYECSAFGLITAAGLLRYMQDAAFDATTAAGYSPERYDEMNRVWLARETEIDVHRLPRYADSVEVRTWVDDFRKVRSRRMYEVYDAQSTELLAHASTDWAFLEKDSGRPASIPPEMLSAFFPNETPASPMPRPRFPTPPPPPAEVFCQPRRAEWRDVDGAWHVNNAVHMAYVEEAAAQVLMSLGWPPDRIRDCGAAVVPARQHIDYRLQAVLDDPLEVTTWAFEAGPDGFSRHTLIKRQTDGELIVQAYSRYNWLDLASGVPDKFPPEFLRDLAPNLSESRS